MSDDDDETDTWSSLASSFSGMRGPVARPRVGPGFMEADRQAAVIRRLLQQDVENGGSPHVLRRLWTVGRLCESPLEDLLLLQMAVSFCPRFSFFRTELLEKPRSPNRRLLQIVTQVQFGPYRVDFLLKPGAEGAVAVECDGADYHGNDARDEKRDRYLAQKCGLSVLRIPGNAILGSEAGIKVVTGLVNAASTRMVDGHGWKPPLGRLKVDWAKRIADHPTSFGRAEFARRALLRPKQDGFS